MSTNSKGSVTAIQHLNLFRVGSKFDYRISMMTFVMKRAKKANSPNAHRLSLPDEAADQQEEHD